MQEDKFNRIKQKAVQSIIALRYPDLYDMTSVQLADLDHALTLRSSIEHEVIATALTFHFNRK